MTIFLEEYLYVFSICVKLSYLPCRPLLSDLHLSNLQASKAGRLNWLLIIEFYDPQSWLLESPTTELLAAYSERRNPIHCKTQVKINGSYFIMDFISYAATTRRWGLYFSHIHMKTAQELSLVSNIVGLEGLSRICDYFLKF